MDLSGTLYWALLSALFFSAGFGTMYVFHTVRSRRKEEAAEITVRPRKLKYPQKMAEEQLVVEEDSEEIEYRPSVHSPTDLDKALTAAVYRAIADRRAGLNLTLTFPEKCKIFGQEVPAKGSVTINGADHEEVERLEKRVAELEEILSKELDNRTPNGLVMGKRTVGGLEENPLF